MTERVKEERPKVALEVKATYADNVISLRMSGATAELPDGRKLEVTTDIGGTCTLVIISNTDKTWRTYFLTAEALAKAVLRQEELLGAKIASSGHESSDKA